MSPQQKARLVVLDAREQGHVWAPYPPGEMSREDWVDALLNELGQYGDMDWEDDGDSLGIYMLDGDPAPEYCDNRPTGADWPERPGI